MEHLKWLGVGSVDVEFYFDFIMTFFASNKYFFFVKTKYTIQIQFGEQSSV